MAQYDVEAAKIKRQRMIADALRESGNTPLPPSIHTGGRFDAPVSGWEYASKALDKVLGAYNARQADKAEANLNERDKAQLNEVLSAQANAQRDDAPSGDLDPVPVMPGPTKAQRQQSAYAAAMRGQQFGGSSAPFSQEIIAKQMFPQQYTLGADDTRMEGDKPIAVGLPRTVSQPADDRAVMEIVDSKAPGGHRSIRRGSFVEGRDQEWQKPAAVTAGATVAAGLEGNALDLAAERYRVTGTLPSGLGRSPQASLKIIQRAAELATKQGDDAGATVLRQQQQKTAVQALGQLSKQEAAVGAFEKTAKNSLKIAQEYSNKVDRTGVPVISRWIQAGQKSITGDKDVSAFHAANETFVSEYAKIMSGSMGNTAVSDATRQHARELISTAMNPDQYNEVIAVLTREMDGRIASFPAQRQELLDAVGGRNPDKNPVTPTSKVIDFSNLPK